MINEVLTSPKINAHMNTIEQGIFIRLVLFEDSHVLENLRIDFDLFVVPDRVFTQKVEAKVVGGLECDMLTTERTTAHGICLILALFIAGSESENIDEVHGCSSLPICHLLRLEFFPIVRPDSIDVVLRHIKVKTRSALGKS